MKTYRDLIVWQKSMDLSVAVYELTNFFPKEEVYGLTSQIKRAATAIPANIAEGQKRGGRREFTQFLRIAYASGAELETHLYKLQTINYQLHEVPSPTIYRY